MKKTLAILLLFLFLIPLFVQIWKPGIFISDDGDWMIIRLAAFYDTLRQGQFPVRFLYNLNHGYGYPVTNFLYPLPFYIGSVFHFLGLNFIDSIKAVLMLATVTGAIGFFALVYLKTKNIVAALLSGIVYSYLPYRLFDLYVRGSLGEILALSFAPFIFLGWEAAKRGSSWGKIVFSIATACLVMSHNTLGLLFFSLFSVLFVADRENHNKVSIFLFLKYSILGLGLCTFFWLPAIYELKYTIAPFTDVSNVSNYFLTIENFSRILGLPIIAIFILCAWSIYRNKFKNFQEIFWSIILLLSILSMLSVFEVFWRDTILSKIIQFPWRLGAISIFSASILYGLTFKFNKIFSIAIFIAVFVTGIMFPEVSRNFYPDSFYSTNDSTTTVKNEYMPKWVNLPIERQPIKKIERININTVQLNTVYYPGWKVLVNNKPVKINYEKNGLIIFSARSNETIKAKFEETPLRIISDIISAFSFVVLFIYLSKTVFCEVRVNRLVKI